MAKPIKIWSGSEWVEVATAIPNLSGYATTSSVTSAISAHESDTTNVHGIADTSVLATESYVDTAESDAVSTANSYTDSAVSNLATNNDVISLILALG